MKLKACPHNEPDGEGNGWADCPPEEATGWIVIDDDTDEDSMRFLAIFDTKAEAEEWIAAQ